MDFLTSTVLAGIAWDGIKNFGIVSNLILKEKLKKWVVSDEDIERIACKINEISEPYKKNEKFLKVAIEEDHQLMKLLENIKSNTEVHNDFQHAQFQKSPVTNAASGAQVTNQNFFGEYKPEVKKTKKEVREELTDLLASNAAVFKMYGPTPENKKELMTNKHLAWRKMAKNLIVPNNDKIIDLLEENKHLLNFEEKTIFHSFKIHAMGFKDNQNNEEKISEYPQFPAEINHILED